MKGQTDMYLDKQTDGRTEKWTNRQIDKQKKALRQMDKQKVR
jgi:hypothetical protein